MKWLFVLLFFSGFYSGYSQTKNFSDTATLYFSELRTATQKNKSLWDIDLNGPVLLVNPATRETYANTADSSGILKKEGEVFIGILPKNVNISNTSVKWSGQHWAMIMLPLSQNKESRINLLTHELFHRAQTALGFVAYNPDNNHLDKRDGRIYLRLELEALKKAMQSTTQADMENHIYAALSFRKYRQSLFTGADSTENLLELNEGICEFTGMMMSGRAKAEQKDQFIRRINSFIASTSYIRSFAYETVPVYGYLLFANKKRWHRDINARADLTKYFIIAFKIKQPDISSQSIIALRKQYNGDNIIAEEIAREERIKKQLAEYRSKFIDEAHVEIPLQNMNMAFDYTRIVPLDDKGTVYPQIRITDNWGVLEVTNGALINQNWNKVNISYPSTINEYKITGDGWTLELKPGFVFEKDTNGKNYILRKN